jgi:hypothetical protein
MDLIGNLKEKEEMLHEEMKLQNDSKIFVKCKDLFHDNENLFWKCDNANEILLLFMGAFIYADSLLHTAFCWRQRDLPKSARALKISTHILIIFLIKTILVIN